MYERLRLPLLILFVGSLVTLLHEYLYARIESEPDYELLGLLSHGGIDMVLATLASAITVHVYLWRRG